MNLNISTQFVNNCLGNNISIENQTSDNGFINLLQELSNININEEFEVENNLDIEYSENDEDINYSFLLSMMTNIQVPKDLNKNIDENVLNDILVESTNNLDKVDNNLISVNIQGKSFENSNENIELDLINKDNKDIENNSLMNKVFNDLDNDLDIDTKSNDFNQSENEQSSSNSQYDNEATTVNAYEELEKTTLISKNNIINNTDIKLSDKDISTLEGIIDNKDSDYFVNFNNTNLNISNVSDKKEISESIVRNIRQEFISEDIINNVNYMKSNGIEEAKFKLTPQNLGDMTIELVKESEETRIHITISKDDVFDLVNKNIGDISKHLKDLNINIKGISVDIKNNNDNFFSDNLDQNFNKKNQHNQKKKSRFDNFEFESIEDIKESKIFDSNLNILI